MMLFKSKYKLMFNTHNMQTFKEGDTVKNISIDSKRYGMTGTVIETDGVSVSVEYPDGHIGSAATGSKYYSIINRQTQFTAGSTRPVKTDETNTGFMHNIATFVKNMTRTAEDKTLIKAGLMDENGLYTTQAIVVTQQEACAAAKARLVEVAEAILADIKEKKAENK